MKELRAEDKLLEGIKHIHMIGIGGSGMCPLAEILNAKGYKLSGSDNNESDPLKRVRNMGVSVYMGDNAEISNVLHEKSLYIALQRYEIKFKIPIPLLIIFMFHYKKATR